MARRTSNGLRFSIRQPYPSPQPPPYRVDVEGMSLRLETLDDGKLSALLGGLLLGHFVDEAAAIEAATVRITSERWRAATGKEKK